MPPRPPTALRIAAACAFALAVAGCRPAATDAGGVAAATTPAPAEAASRPIDAAYVLRDRLLARDGAGFARLAVPPALHQRLAAGWKEGRTRWPLDELPLDSRIPGMLVALQAPNAQRTLMATFRQQFAGADRDIDQAIRTLAVFGGDYVQKEAGYTPEERDHIAQAIAALSAWGLRAPFADRQRAEPFFAALVAAARRSGIDGKSADPALARLGLDAGLDRISPFLATLLDQLHRQYGLDLDASLRGLKVELLQQTGDQARLRLRYPLAGQWIDAVVPAVRIDGHWYLADYVRRAEAGLEPAATPPAGGGKPAPP